MKPIPVTAQPASAADSAAYRKGLCKTCHIKPHRAGHTECDECWSARTGHDPHRPPWQASGYPSWRRPPGNYFVDLEDDVDPDHAGVALFPGAYLAALPRCVCCDQPLLAPVSIDRGYCEACRRAAVIAWLAAELDFHLTAEYAVEGKQQ